MSATRNVVGLPGDHVVMTQDVGRGAFAARKGERAEIVGFERVAYGRTHNHGLRPGIYENPAYPVVRTALGRSITMGRHLIEPADGGPGRTVARGDLRVADLPDSPFWEMDAIRTRDGREMRVESVDYLALSGDGRSNGSPFRCLEADGGIVELGPEAMTLVARGPVWRRANGEEPSFADAAETGAFHQAVGECEELRNPATGTFAWDLDQAVEAFAGGEAHGFRGGFPTASTGLHLVRYADEAVGETVRQDTLGRLGVTTSPAP